jgi:peptide/nickel transport system permease protein
VNWVNRINKRMIGTGGYLTSYRVMIWRGSWALLRAVVARPRSPVPFRMLLTNPLSLIGALIMIGFAGVAVTAPYLAPPENPSSAYSIPRDGFKPEPQPPSAEHPFGTTAGQYDIYYGVVWGTRTAFKVGLLVTGGAVLIGLILGSLAAYYGGWLDEILMRVVDIFMAFPFLLAAITLSVVITSKAPQMQGIYIGMVALSAFAWMGYARLIRGDILAIKGRDYILAAKSIGAGDLRILVRHILPNAIYPTLVVASMDIGSYVLIFSALSFLGLGAEVGYADWGQLVAFARNWLPSLTKYWHVIVFPGGAILLFVLAWNLIGDALRDILDPRLLRRHF